MKAFVTGIGWVSAAGPGRGRAKGAFAMPAGVLPEISRKEVFAAPDRRFGRLDPFSRTGLAAIAFALRDAGLEEWDSKRPFGLLAESACGCLATDGAYFDTVLEEGGSLASPHLFAYTLPNTFLGEAAIRFGLSGGGLVLSGAGPRGSEALTMALENLEWGDEKGVLAGICDLEAPPPLEAPEGAAPGALFVVLEREPAGGLAPLGELSIAEGLALDGCPVADLPSLVRACHKNSRG
ncbi:MAG: beta-ketoacyl synthase [Desulfuromonas sp.]|uniref:beta-ketoacyl synthase N-terminal-like domain-containing protein n=1 Tax=Desulfuromonas sp. TaxID=892 RepID=UPI000CB74847|nr:beta-ketoacyl synthase N-terminal-like domain-containing protein [Desulfuromonas sp.]PLX85242.1 MAG: beta-ketoacyl synthase [Desulfuromonas sp.]